jgi:ankyrin repeat protein
MGTISEGRYRPLHVAAFLGQVTGVALLLDAGADVDGIDARGFSPLHWAVRERNQEVVELLLAKGEQIDGASSSAANGKRLPTPLFLASSAWDPGVALTLLERGANVDARDASGAASLHVAVRYGRYETVKALLAHGAAVDVCDHEGTTPLHLAARQGDVPAVDLLLSHGASVTALSNGAGTALHEVASHQWPPPWYKAKYGTAELDNYVAIARTLLGHGADVRQRSRRGWLPIGLALANRATPIAELLTQRDSNVQEVDSAAFERFHTAVSTGDQAAVAELLEATPDVMELPLEYEERMQWGEVRHRWCHALHVAARERRWSMMRLLVSHGAPLDVRDAGGRTPLHFVATVGRVSVAKAMLRLGAQPNAREVYWPHRSPLDFAIAHGHHALAGLLLAWDVPRNPDHPVLKQALFEAVAHADASMVAMVLAHREENRTPGSYRWLRGFEAMDKAVMPALHRRNSAMLDVLLSYGADLNAVIRWDARPLHKAADAGDMRELRLLLRLDVEVNPRDRNGKTPLHLAARACHSSAVRLLIADDAEVNAADHHGETPLFAAVMAALIRGAPSSAVRGALATVTKLRRAGATPGTPNTSGVTALALAEGSGDASLSDALTNPINGA